MEKKILIVDDSAFMRSMIKNILVKNGYTEILEASSPKEAIAIYKEQNPQIVTMDVIMETSGIDCVKDIKEIDANANIIMVSAMGQEPFIMEGIKNGACDFIVKPFEKKKIIEAVSKIEEA